MALEKNIFLTPLVCARLLSGTIEKVNFKFGSYEIRASMYTEVAKRISSGKLEVFYDGNKGEEAEYDPTDNRMILGFTDVKPVAKASLLVHEATHAICDYQKRSINRVTSEALAYIAQALFFETARPGEFLDGPCNRQASTVLSWRDKASGVINAPITAVESLRDVIVANYANALTFRPNYNGI